MKIARVVVDGVATSPFQQEALRAMRRLADSSGTALVAEGIEQEADLRICRDLGIDYAQGYLLARPTAEPPLTISEDALRVIRSGPVEVLRGDKVSEPGTDAVPRLRSGE